MNTVATQRNKYLLHFSRL